MVTINAMIPIIFMSDGDDSNSNKDDNDVVVDDCQDDNEHDVCTNLNIRKLSLESLVKCPNFFIILTTIDICFVLL